MADIQIQDLPPATTPLGSGDVIPIVQSGITKSVTISSGEFVLADSPNVFTSSNTFSATGSSYRLRITSGSGNGKYVVYQTGGSTRWEAGSNSSPEVGANAGSDFIINRYDDTGTYIDTPFIIDRDSGSVGLNTGSYVGGSTGSGNFTVSGGAGNNRSYYLQTNFSSRWQISANSTSESGANSGSNFAIVRYNDAGSSLATTLTINRATGLTSLESLSVSGDVGIGTSSPGAKLDVVGPAGGTSLRLTDNTNSTLNIKHEGPSNLLTYETNGTANQRWVLNGSERMRLDNSGNALIGYTTSNGAYKLQVNSQIFATNATIATSDGNYKENITPLDGALDLVSALNPVQFSWKEHPVHNFDRAQPTVGFIAQEVQQALADTPYLNSIVKANTCTIEPEELDDEGNVTKPAVTEEFLGIAEGNMIALLTKAIQELKAEFDTYKASHP